MLELIYLFTCLFAYCLCILFISKKDLKSVFKKTLENKGEIGKRKQKKKKGKANPASPPWPIPPPSCGPIPHPGPLSFPAQRARPHPSSFLRPTFGPHSFSPLTARPHRAEPFLLHRIRGGFLPQLRADSVNSVLSFLSCVPSFYKASRSTPRPPLCI